MIRRRRVIEPHWLFFAYGLALGLASGAVAVSSWCLHYLRPVGG